MLYILAIVELIAVIVFGFEFYFATNMMLLFVSGAISVILGGCLALAASDPEKEEA